jgi:hypothetical protein
MPRPFKVAHIAIDRPQNMTRRGRRDIASWLIRRANSLDGEGSNYTTGTFLGRYYFNDAVDGETKTAASVRVHAAGALSVETRKRIARWMLSRARHLTSGRGVFGGRWFTQEFHLS